MAGLEDLTGVNKYISDLVNTNPDGSIDSKNQGDDHIRGIKNVILNTFPNVTGIVTKTHTQINNADDWASGTLAIFQQTAAPNGWTKQVTHNDKALRIVSGTVGSGGSQAFTTAFATGRAVSGTAITLAQMPAHNHGGGSHRHTLTMYPGADSGGISVGSNNVRTNPQTMNPGDMGLSGTIINLEGSGATHNHTIGMDVNYVDTIIASKD